MATAAPDKMTTTRTDLNPCTVELTVSCSEDQIKKGFAKALKKLSKQLRIPGFRPGHAPASMVEKAVNPQTLFEEALEEIVNETADKAIDEEGIIRNARPGLTVESFEKDPPALVYKLKIPLAPVVELADYKGVPVTRKAVEVTDDEIDGAIEQFRQRANKKQQQVDRGAESGDMAVVNLHPKDHEARTSIVVVGQGFTGLDEAVQGMKAEEFKSVELEFPSDYQEKDWAGKKMLTTVTLRSLSELSAPKLDDDFAKSLQASDLKDLREKVREGIVRAKEESNQEMVNDQLLTQILEKSTVHVADNTWEQVADTRLREMADSLARVNSTLETYAENHNMTLEELVKVQREEARLHVMRALVVEKVFTTEGMQVTNDDFNTHFLQIAAENQVRDDQLEKFAKDYGAQIRDEVVFRAMYSKVMAFLTENAQITESAAVETEEKAPVKKSKAKSKKAEVE